MSDRGKIFLSYWRQDGAAAVVTRLADYLDRRFGDGTVFRDVQIRPGARWDEAIDNALRACEALVLVIGPGWLPARDATGLRRIEYPSHSIQAEVERAVERDIPILPVLVGGVEMPLRGEFSGVLQRLADRKFVRLDDEAFESGMEMLVHALESALHLPRAHTGDRPQPTVAVPNPNDPLPVALRNLNEALAITPPYPQARLSDELFYSLHSEALGVLSYAEGLRLAMRHDVISMGQLVVALATHPNTGAQRFLHAKACEPEVLGEAYWGLKQLPEPKPVTLTSFPHLSEDVAEAFDIAARAGAAQAAPNITTRYLLYGVLSIEKSSPAQYLRSLGINKDEVLTDVPEEVVSGAPVVAPEPNAEPPSPSAWRSERPGVASDTVVGQEDLLGLEREVEVMGSIMAAHDVEPPVSIGLFGDWGTGKTFFMKEIEAWINRMTKQAREAAKDPAAPRSAYCTNIVQLWFNAWHYIDANLWASLTAEIFEGLGCALRKDGELTNGVDDPEQARARLLAAASSARDVLAEAERRKSDAEADSQAIQQSLNSLRSNEVAIARSLVTAAVDVAREQPEVKEKLAEAGKALGVPAVQAASKKLQSQVREIGGLVGSLRALWIAMGQRPWLTTLLVAGGAAIGVGAVLLSPRVFGGAASAKVTGVIAFLGTLIGPYVPKIVRAKKLITDTLEKHRNALREAEEKRKVELVKRQTEVRGQMEVAERRLEEARTTVHDLDKKLAALRADTRMSEFVTQRRESTDYTQHLGVVARARRDFERLSLLLRQGKDESKREGAAADGVSPADRPQLPRIDRIILYIDDLDRCPEDKVVEVLQAVHLLLAFPLFIVVVGVDSRWLLHSLKRRTGIFREADAPDDGMSDDERVHWRSTPLNYLEKIFQIPFSLRPMEFGGFERLIQILAPAAPTASAADGKEAGTAAKGDNGKNGGASLGSTSGSSAIAAGDTGGVSPAEPRPTGPKPGSSPDLATATSAQIGVDQARGGARRSSTAATGVAGAAARQHAPIDLNPAHLRISLNEQTLMTSVFPFIPSPRAAKRFVNVYRLLRATVKSDDWGKFLGADGAGDYRAVLLLLAILIGYPTEGTEILRDLVEDPHNGTWWEAMDKYRWRAGLESDWTTSMDAGEGPDATTSQVAERLRWQELLTKLHGMRKAGVVGEMEPCAAFSSWASHVARYSFESGRITMARGSAAGGDKAGKVSKADKKEEGVAERADA